MQSNETSNFFNYGRVCDRLNKLLAPTRENVELIRDTYAGCKAAFEKDRMGSRRRYDVDITPHLLTTPAFADNIPHSSHQSTSRTPPSTIPSLSPQINVTATACSQQTIPESSQLKFKAFDTRDDLHDILNLVNE